MLRIDADRITKFCFDFYEKNIPDKIKPTKNEWTTLASIVMIKNHNELQGYFTSNNNLTEIFRSRNFSHQFYISYEIFRYWSNNGMSKYAIIGMMESLYHELSLVYNSIILFIYFLIK